MPSLLLSRDAHPDADEPVALGAPWTMDMDDMLRMLVRAHAFQFDVAAPHLQQYVGRVRAAGGMLPKAVQPELYDANECRLRWAELDRLAILGGEAADETPSVTPPAPSAAPVAAAPPQLAPRGIDAESDDDSDDEGVLDVNALRNRLMGVPVPDPPTRAAAPAAPPPTTSAPQPPAARQQSARENAPIAAPGELPDVAEQLAAIERMTAGGGGEAASELIGPLMQLRAQVDAFRDDGATSPAARIDALRELTSSMAQLQQRALTWQAAGGHAAGADAASANGAPRSNGHNGAAHGGPIAADASGAGPGGGIDLAAGLDALDLDGLIADLERRAA